MNRTELKTLFAPRKLVTPSAVRSLRPVLAQRRSFAGSERLLKGASLKGAGKKCVPFAALLALLLSTQLAQAQTPTPPTTVEEETAARIEADNALRDSITDTDISTTQGINAAGTRITNEIRDRTSADTALGARIDAIDGTAETTAREAADATLTTAVADETTARTDADTALGARIDGVATARTAAIATETTARTAAIATETTARTDADTALGARIDAISTFDDTALSAADTALDARIDGEATARTAAIATETTARTDADTALGARIDAISTFDNTALSAADTALGARIDGEATARTAAIATETTARTTADTALDGRVTAEATAREAADTALDGRVTAEETARTDADTALGTRIDEAAMARLAINERLNSLGPDGIYDDTALTNRVNSLDRKVNELEKELSAGVALSLAMQAPMVSQGSKLNLTFGVGTYNGENAFALSFGARVNKRWTINGGFGLGTSERDLGARMGATIEF